MLPLIDILIILSEISAAQAGPIRRYANTTSLPPTAINGVATGVIYRPYAGSPSLSLVPIQGITKLPFSESAAETPAEVPAASSSTALALGETSTAVVTRAASFQYQPMDSNANDDDGTSSTPCKSRASGPPTSFWTFGDQHIDTVTRTSTTWVTVSVPPQVVESSSPQEQEPAASQAQNTTTTFVPVISPTFSFNTLPTTTDSSTTESEATTTTANPLPTASPTSSNPEPPSDTSTFAYPYPTSDTSTTSFTATDPHDDATETSTESSSTTYYSDLPVVVTEGTPPETQSQQSMATTTDTTAIPGITIVPQNPSVIYITVTDAGATTTVTA